MLIWARRWYIQRRKNRIDTYYKAIDEVINRLHDGTDLREITELETELLKIRQRASAELVKEQLAANESYIIYQNMLNGCQAMLVRMREKIQASPEKDA
jgi:predicted metalloenzyme YecM